MRRPPRRPGLTHDLFADASGAWDLSAVNILILKHHDAADDAADVSYRVAVCCHRPTPNGQLPTRTFLSHLAFALAQ
jgi:hypothetical protein